MCVRVMQTNRTQRRSDGRFQKRAFEAAEAYDLAQEGEEEDDDDNDWREDLEEEDEEEETGDPDDDELAPPSRLPLSPESSAAEDGNGSSSDRPSELVLRFLPLLSEALHSKLRPGEGEGEGGEAPQIGAEAKGGAEWQGGGGGVIGESTR